MCTQGNNSHIIRDREFFAIQFYVIIKLTRNFLYVNIGKVEEK